MATMPCRPSSHTLRALPTLPGRGPLSGAACTTPLTLLHPFQPHLFTHAVLARFSEDREELGKSMDLFPSMDEVPCGGEPWLP